MKKKQPAGTQWLDVRSPMTAWVHTQEADAALRKIEEGFRELRAAMKGGKGKKGTVRRSPRATRKRTSESFPQR